jgi:hypothetical protein
VTAGRLLELLRARFFVAEDRIGEQGIEQGCVVAGSRRLQEVLDQIRS